MQHDIKLKQIFADAVLDGDKTFEVRVNDRNYQRGDTVRFTVIDEEGKKVFGHLLNGKVYKITYVLSGWGIGHGYVVFSIKPVEEDGECIDR